MTNILVINGANLNMLGIREPEIYGKQSYKDLEKYLEDLGKELHIRLDVFQSNYEGAIVEEIQDAYNRYQGIVINAGAYTHTSIAILDALKAVNIPTIEVHLSDINSREDFRKQSYISLFAKKVIAGKGFEGYRLAVEELLK